MTCEQKFYVCKHCGNLVGMIYASGVKMICCGEEMQEIIPNTVDAAVEKHIPQISTADGIATVKVGSVPHPMTVEHLIQWVYLQTTEGGHRKCLGPEDAPEVKFALTKGEEPIAAFAFCNLHGLWKQEV